MVGLPLLRVWLETVPGREEEVGRAMIAGVGFSPDDARPIVVRGARRLVKSPNGRQMSACRFGPVAQPART